MSKSFQAKDLTKGEWEAQQTWLLLLACIGAIAAAVGGWAKLKFGLSFIDEGMYLTDGWRLANGDSLFPDANRFAASFYHVFASWIFVLWPEAGVLDIRKVQFFLNLLALGACFALLMRDRPRWEVALSAALASPFLFTGLDPTGMGTSLNYYTVTAFFYLFYTLALRQYFSSSQGSKGEAAWGFSAGLAIAAAGISYLAIGAAGVLFFLLHPLLKRPLTLRQSLLFLLPATLYPALIYPNFAEHWQAIQALFEAREGGPFFMPYTLPYLVHGAVFTALFALTLLIREKLPFLLTNLLLALLLSASLKTRGFGFLPLFWNGWFKIPGMVATLNACGAVAFFAVYISKVYRKPKAAMESLPLILVSCFALYAGLFAVTSSLGVMLFVSCSFLLWLGIALALAPSQGALRTWTVMLACCLPASGFLMQADYRFTYFDKSPDQLTTVIKEGPAKGIQTNELTAFVDSTLRKAVAQNSSPGDLILSFDQTPMAYFLTKRRPALDHSWTGITGGNTNSAKHALQKMIVTKRQPKLALYWQNKLLWVPTDESLSQFNLSGFSSSAELPIAGYVQSNMAPAASLNIGERTLIQIFTAKKPSNDS